MVTPQESAAPGDSELTVTLRGIRLAVFTYRPEGCKPQGLLFIFHGLHRNAADYRSWARPFASLTCLIVFAPRFERDRFRGWQYQLGGIARHQIPQSPDDWTVSLVTGLVRWAQAREDEAMPVFLFGHSAGAQFLSRVAAYAPPKGISRFVIANPSTHVWPSLEEAIPYGFGGFPVWFPAKATASLKRYLSLPVTIYIGSGDTGTRFLSRQAAAVRQGANRFVRGKNVFYAARALARKNGWDFNWKYVVALGALHSTRQMLGSFEIRDAFGLGE